MVKTSDEFDKRDQKNMYVMNFASENVPISDSGVLRVIRAADLNKILEVQKFAFGLRIK